MDRETESKSINSQKSRLDRTSLVNKGIIKPPTQTFLGLSREEGTRDKPKNVCVGRLGFLR